MPIEFNCSQCQSQLRVKDEHAGKSARCPSCQAVNTIPMISDSLTANEPTENVPGGMPGPETSNPFAASMPIEKAQPAGTNNPYQSPTTSKLEAQPLLGGQLRPTAVAFEEVWTPAWQCWSANLGLTVACTATLLGVNFLFSIISNILVVVAAELNSEAAVLISSFLVSFISFVAQQFLNIGFVRICLKLLQRQQTGYGELFSGIDVMLPVIGGGILFGLMLTAGLIMLIIPFFFVGLIFWCYMYLIIEKRTGVFESFSVAYQLGNRNKLTSFVLIAVSIGLGFAGLLMCYIGLLFTTGLTYMLFASCYLKMGGRLR